MARRFGVAGPARCAFTPTAYTAADIGFLQAACSPAIKLASIEVAQFVAQILNGGGVLSLVVVGSLELHFENAGFGHQVVIGGLEFCNLTMVGFDHDAHPGLWRPGSARVLDRLTGEAAYEGPPADLVGGLVDELVASLRAARTEPPLVRAAMAHLNLIMIRPFARANGRMARLLHTLLAALGGPPRALAFPLSSRQTARTHLPIRALRLHSG